MKNSSKYLLRILILMITCQNTLVASLALTEPRLKIGINSDWQFRKDKVQEWQPIALPHSWNTQDPFDEKKEYYRGVGWYQKKLDLSHFPKKEKVFIYFEAANQVTEVFVNDRSVGIHQGGYTAFCFDLTPFLNYKKDVLKVKVDNSHHKDIVPLQGDFTFYGGIYRDVFLILTNDTHLEITNHASKGIFLTTPSVKKEKATVQLKGVVNQESNKHKGVQITTTILDREGKVITTQRKNLNLKKGKNKFIQDLAVDFPKLWSPDNPYLYSCKTQILSNNSEEILDEVNLPLGFRWFSFDANKGFFLNGKSLKLMGVNRHQDFPNRANALTNAEHLRDLKLIKSMGANFLRTAHYPQDPALLEACDRLGLLVSMEIPLDHDMTYELSFHQVTKTMLREMMLQYHHHPSIIIWAYMNEMFLNRKLGRDEKNLKRIVELARVLEKQVREEDPTRYTMIPNHGDFEVYFQSGLTEIPQIVGWNLYYGWYENDLDGFGKFIDNAHAKVPDKPILITEYGAGGDPRIRSFNPLRFDFSMEWETKFHQSHLTQILERPFIAGGAVWNMFDFGSENRRDAVPHINNKGLMSFDRKPKDAFYLYQAYLAKKPVLRLAASTWNLRAGNQNGKEPVSNQPIEVLSNFAQVELFHNGKSLGLKNGQDYVFSWEVPFIDGENTLEAKGKDKNNTTIVDRQVISFNLYSNQNLADQDLITINFGTDFIFVDDINQNVWMPEKNYQNDAWGYIGGKQFFPRDRGVGTDRDILSTIVDPLFQTQRQGVEQINFKLSKGKYRITLLLAEVENIKNGERIFSIFANGSPLIQNLDMAKTYGKYKAISSSFDIYLEQDLLSIRFDALQGETIINAIQIEKSGY